MVMDENRKSRRPFVRNHYLPQWAHRICNALLTALVVLLPTIYVFPLRFALTADVALFFLVVFTGPNKISFVEGIAGEDGYVDLDDKL